MSDENTIGSGIHVRECNRCGEEFYGLSGHVAQKNLEEHKDDCRVKERNHTNDARVNVKITPPRQLDQYEYTEHFQSMLTRRDDPPVTSDVVTATVKRGVIKSTHISKRVIFEWYDADNYQWWVIAKMREAAFREPEKSHLLLTVYAKNSPAHEQVEKYA
jgi:hypothetical protein